MVAAAARLRMHPHLGSIAAPFQRRAVGLDVARAIHLSDTCRAEVVSGSTSSRRLPGKRATVPSRKGTRGCPSSMRLPIPREPEIVDPERPYGPQISESRFPSLPETFRPSLSPVPQSHGSEGERQPLRVAGAGCRGSRLATAWWSTGGSGLLMARNSSTDLRYGPSPPRPRVAPLPRPTARQSRKTLPCRRMSQPTSVHHRSATVCIDPYVSCTLTDRHRRPRLERHVARAPTIVPTT